MTKPLVAGDYDPPQGVDVYCLSMLGMESRDLHACRLKSWHARSSVTRSRAYGFEIMSTEELTKKVGVLAGRRGDIPRISSSHTDDWRWEDRRLLEKRRLVVKRTSKTRG